MTPILLLLLALTQGQPQTGTLTPEERALTAFVDETADLTTLPMMTRRMAVLLARLQRDGVE